MWLGTKQTNKSALLGLVAHINVLYLLQVFLKKWYLTDIAGFTFLYHFLSFYPWQSLEVEMQPWFWVTVWGQVQSSLIELGRLSFFYIDLDKQSTRNVANKAPGLQELPLWSSKNQRNGFIWEILWTVKYSPNAIGYFLGATTHY